MNNKIFYIGGIGNSKTHEGQFDKLISITGGTQGHWQHLTECKDILDYAPRKNFLRNIYSKFMGDFIYDAINYHASRLEIISDLSKQIPEGCTTIVGHSLGSIIAYDLVAYMYATKSIKLKLVTIKLCFIIC